ncbi:hypothetical protein [Oryza sativa Japonica Group]|uniref:Uncharacterized protein n=1 Tax=Oryza sativa subsp. japonica TaxID=39947 RepID=Q5N9G4_ORYSJ|nr:hypothetical protein [Oryza sativa Japonica Group]BAD81889.1 hypothetical protein [Oryza sativa Japonica Group]
MLAKAKPKGKAKEMGKCKEGKSSARGKEGSFVWPLCRDQSTSDGHHAAIKKKV